MTAQDSLNYGNLMQQAMRRMMADVLVRVAEEGLPGEHHFYICFETHHPGVDIPDWLRETYPDEMTIVLQEWFRDLAVTPDRFSVTLNFSDQAQTLVIPFAAVRTFVDPSVKFGLKFDAYDADERLNMDDDILDGPGAGQDAVPVEADNDTPDRPGSADAAAHDGDGAEDNAETGGAQIVSIDSFRKP